MYAQVEKPKENKSRAVANSVGQNKSYAGQGFGFVDNRTKAFKARQHTMNDRVGMKILQYTMTDREAVGVLDQLKLNMGNLTPEGKEVATAHNLQRTTIKDYAHCDGRTSRMHITVVDDRTNRTYQVPVYSGQAGQWSYDVYSSVTG
ncbi:MAG: hypothetical protein HRT58_03630 [Crocinitomicaceae bacterium]|nr:hypothetical protein [Flavobacteriales bacterium]NQZ34724.1 hypothetical protein [Crocinitomicaceae bacterium]